MSRKAIDGMSIGSQGENLIFMISQPRAGSTMLQRMLGSHPNIHTVSEPWLMLHPLYALRSKGYEAEYNAHLAWLGGQSFLRTLPDGEEEYIEGVRRMYTYLYERALLNSGKRYFLDKTPRYYFITSELHHTFPKACYIILLRNPLAVLISILNTWAGESRFSLYKYKYDLTRAPHLLLEAVDALGKQCAIVHYEQLVRDPENQTRGICGRLGIDFAPEMVEYGHHNLPRWRFGDQQEVYHHTRPALRNTEKWVLALDRPQVWRLANDYLQFLGPKIVEQMGYSFHELQQILEAHRPRRIRLWLTFPLAWLLNKWTFGFTQSMQSLRRKGIRATARTAIRNLAYVNRR
jgi:hypothetical protein